MSPLVHQKPKANNDPMQLPIQECWQVQHIVDFANEISTSYSF